MDWHKNWSRSMSSGMKVLALASLVIIGALHAGQVSAAIQACPNGLPGTPYTDMTVTSGSPAYGATITDLRNPVIRMTFSKNLNPASVTDSNGSNRTFQLYRMDGGYMVPVNGAAVVSGNTATFKPSGPLIANSMYLLYAKAAPRNANGTVTTTSNAYGTLGVEGVQVNCVEWPLLKYTTQYMFKTGSDRCVVTPVAGTGSTDVLSTFGGKYFPMNFQVGRQYEFQSNIDGHLINNTADPTGENDAMTMTFGGLSSSIVRGYDLIYGDASVHVRAEGIKYKLAADCNSGQWVADRVTFTRYDMNSSTVATTLATYVNQPLPNPATCTVQMYYPTVTSSSDRQNMDATTWNACGTLSWKPQ